MNKNLGKTDRVFRILAATAMLVCSLAAPLPLWARLAFLAVPGVYVLATALVGHCLGYRMIGISTCRLPPGGS